MKRSRINQAFRSGRVRLALGFILALVFGMVLVEPYSELTQFDYSLSLQAPSWEHPLGCDAQGRDVLRSLLLGAQSTLFIALAAVSLSLVLGALVGMLAGYWGGWLDLVTCWVIDIVLAFPGILLALFLTSILGPSQINIVIAMVATGWTGVARLARGSVLSLSQRDYVKAASALGAGHGRILRKHILPFLIPYFVVSASFSMASVIIVESSLSFLGLGATDGPPTWGSLLNQGAEVLTEAPHLSLFPGLVLAMTVLCFNLAGDALNEILDGRL